MKPSYDISVHKIIWHRIDLIPPAILLVATIYPRLALLSERIIYQRSMTSVIERVE